MQEHEVCHRQVLAIMLIHISTQKHHKNLYYPLDSLCNDSVVDKNVNFLNELPFVPELPTSLQDVSI